jgi:predicted MPP superfamily phosphohydrolase
VKISRRHFFRTTLASVPCGVCYVTLGEPNWLDVTHTTIRIGATPLPRPIRIAQLSDFHLSTDVPLSLISRAIDEAIAQKPDLICVTGDFITDQLSEETKYAAELRKLTEAAPAFAILGNHDGGDWAGRHGGYEDTKTMADFVSSTGLKLLHNETCGLRFGGTKLRLTGVGDAWSGECKPAEALQSSGSEHHAHVLLAHNPDTKDDVKDFGWDVMLSGHTHGGQCALPLIGGGYFAPVKDKAYVSGLYKWNERHLFVNRGIGSILGLRFNCRPEVSIITLA